MREQDDARGGTIRVLLAEIPRLLAALIEQSIASQRDMRVVDNVRRADQIGAVVIRNDVDVIVTGLPAPDMPEIVHDLFFSESRVPILAISSDGSSIEVYGRCVVRQLVPDELVMLIREMARQRGD